MLNFVILVKIEELSWMTPIIFPAKNNEKYIREEIYLLEEKRMEVVFTSIVVEESTTSGYNCYIEPRELQTRDLVLQRADIRNKKFKDGKLACNWEIPYCIHASTEGEQTPRTWNVTKLKRYYS